MKMDHGVSFVTQNNESFSRRSRRHVEKKVDAALPQIAHDPGAIDKWLEEFLSSGHYTRLPQRVQKLIPMAVEATQEHLFTHKTRPEGDLRPFEVEGFFFPKTLHDIVGDSVNVDNKTDFEEAAFDWLLWLCQSSKLTYAQSIQKTLRYIKGSPLVGRI